MEREEILGILKDSGAMLTGHFKLSSGLHAEKYFQCAQLQQYPDLLARLCGALAEKWRDSGVTAVVGPAVGAIVIAYELARQLGVRGLFMERAPGGGFEFRRGFNVGANDRVLVAEDVVTTGKSVREVLEALRTTQAELLGVASLICRNTDVDFGVDYRYLIEIETPAYEPDECPLCGRGEPVTEAREPTGRERVVMIRSMTGYGRVHFEGEDCAVTVEARSVNGRFLKISVRAPELWERLIRDIEGLVKEGISRGSVFVTVRKLGTVAGAREFLINRQAIEEYRRQLAEVEGGKEITLAELLALPGTVGTADETDAELDEVWRNVSGLVRRALDEMVAMRTREGEHLREVLLAVVERLLRLAAEVRRGAPEMVANYRTRLETRLRDLLEGTDVTFSDDSLARELAIFAERSDIREEIDRMESHLKQVALLLDEDGPVGRRLEFLAQEMLRETNTMGSKVAEVALSKVVLDMKVEVDRLKEQVMNVE